METRGGSCEEQGRREQEQCSRAEVWGAAVGVAALALMFCLAAVEHITAAVWFGHAVYAGLAVVAGVGGVAWVVARAEARVRRDLGGRVVELATALAELQAAVLAQRTVYLPGQGRVAGQAYKSAAVGGQGDTVPLRQPGTGLTPEVIAAARSIARALADGTTGGSDGR